MLSRALLSLLLVSAATALAKHNARSGPGFSKRGGDTFSNYYAGVGEGACGAWHTDSEFVVALTTLMWDNGAHCGKEIQISSRGKSTTAKIVDECMGCPYNGLDLSQSLFSFFVGEGNNNIVGMLYDGDWSYTDGSGGGGGGGGDTGPGTTTTTSTTSTTPKATPKPTSTTTSTTTTSTTTSTTSKASSTAISKSSAPASASTQASATASAPSSTPSATDGPQNLYDFTQALLDLSGLIVDAQGAA